MKVVAERIEAYRENADGSVTEGTCRVVTDAFTGEFVRVDDFMDLEGEPMTKVDGEKLFLRFHIQADN